MKTKSKTSVKPMGKLELRKKYMDLSPVAYETIVRENRETS